MNEEKQSTDDLLSDALDVEFEVKEKKETPIVKKIDSLPVSQERLEKDASNDYSKVRNNLQDLIDTGKEAIEGILNVALDSDSPRAYEVASQMIKTVAETNKDLMGLHKQMKDINKDETNVNNTTNNSLYIGSTSELQDLINQSRSASKAFLPDDIVDVEVEDDK